jgi:metallophosphoesterase superfamily enzyme
MKTIILGDTHGNDIWKKIVEEESPDKVIFVGDYFDSFDISFAKQMYNFNEILDYKKSGNAEVTLLIGNHDYHYLPFVYENYSGYQMHNRMTIENAFYENMNHFKICHSIDNILISHAGVSNT